MSPDPKLDNPFDEMFGEEEEGESENKDTDETESTDTFAGLDLNSIMADEEAEMDSKSFYLGFLNSHPFFYKDLPSTKKNEVIEPFEISLQASLWRNWAEKFLTDFKNDEEYFQFVKEKIEGKSESIEAWIKECLAKGWIIAITPTEVGEYFAGKNTNARFTNIRQVLSVEDPKFPSGQFDNESSKPRVWHTHAKKLGKTKVTYPRYRLYVSLLYRHVSEEGEIQVMDKDTALQNFFNYTARILDTEHAFIDIDKYLTKSIDVKFGKKTENTSHLYDFKEQHFYPKSSSNEPSIMDYLDDLVNYVESYYLRVCPSCNTTLTEEEIAYLGQLNDLFEQNKPMKYILHDALEGLAEERRVTIDQGGKVKDIMKNVTYQTELADNSLLGEERLGLQKKYALNQKICREKFICPSCGNSIFKSGLKFVGHTMYKILHALRGKRGSLIVGNPGDGKSDLVQQILKYMEYRYSVPYKFLNVDESTTAYHLRGGFNPSAFVSTEEKYRIFYGMITQALRQGFNVGIDEINRTDFRNLAFLMGFFEAPNEYTLLETGEIYKNPNKTPDGIPKWLIMASLNRGDIGNNDMSPAFKSRFDMIEQSYSPEDQVQILEKILFSLSPAEKELVETLIESTADYVNTGEFAFPAGIRHLNRFITSMRMIVNDVIEHKLDNIYEATEKLPKGKKKDIVTPLMKYQLEKLLEDQFFSIIILPMTDENDESKVNTLRSNYSGLVEEFAGKYATDINDGNFVLYY